MGRVATNPRIVFDVVEGERAEDSIEGIGRERRILDGAVQVTYRGLRRGGSNTREHLCGPIDADYLARTLFDRVTRTPTQAAATIELALAGKLGQHAPQFVPLSRGGEI